MGMYSVALMVVRLVVLMDEDLELVTAELLVTESVNSLVVDWVGMTGEKMAVSLAYYKDLSKVDWLVDYMAVLLDLIEDDMLVERLVVELAVK